MELWRNVIFQAILDTLIISKKEKYVKVKDEAILWLTTHSDDFKEVMKLAVIDYEDLKTIIALINEYNNKK